LTQGERPLAEATLHREGLVQPDVAPLRTRWAADHDTREKVPGTATCLACGSANPLGLGIRLRANDRFLWGAHTPSPVYRTREGAHPALALIILDELGWWLGALAHEPMLDRIVQELEGKLDDAHGEQRNRLRWV
jgi:hypothetical protein